MEEGGVLAHTVPMSIFVVAHTLLSEPSYVFDVLFELWVRPASRYPPFE